MPLPLKYNICEFTGNFYDILKNISYNLQKYTNACKNIKALTQTTPDIAELTELKIFLMCENESILKNKMIQSANEITQTIIQKYDIFLSSLGLHEKDELFYIDYNHIHKALEICDKIETEETKYMSYSHSHNQVDVYQFEETTTQIENKYRYLTVIDEMTAFERDDLINLYKGIINVLYKRILRLKEKLEFCSSTYLSAIIINDLLLYLYMAYICVRNISKK